MLLVSEAEASVIRAVYEQRGELSAAVELRRRFPGILDNAQARECARIIAGWRPMPKLPKAGRVIGAKSRWADNNFSSGRRGSGTFR